MSRFPSQAHLEWRGNQFYWRRRWPKRIVPDQGDINFFRKSFLLFPLRTDFLRDAKVLARRLTDLSDMAFAALAEKTMTITAPEMETLLTGLCRFQIEAADLAREIAPERSLEAAAYEADCARAALDALRQAYLTRNREIARAPLRATADRLGLQLDEEDADWPRLAMRALQAMIEAGEENIRRDQGLFERSGRSLAPAPAPGASATVLPGGPTREEHAHPRDAGTAAGLAALGISPDAISGNATSDRTGVPTARTTSAVAPAAASKTLHATSPDRTGQAEASQEKREHVARLHAGASGSAKKHAISEVTEEYISARCAGYTSFKATETANLKAGESYRRNSAANVRATGKLLEKLLPVDDIRDITPEMLRDAWETITRLPTNYGRSSKERRTPRELAEAADLTDARNESRMRQRLEKEGASPGKIEFEVNAGRSPRMRVATVYRHMQDFQRVCKFAVTRGYLDTNIMADHIWEKREVERRELLQEDNKRETWSDALGQLFRTPVFQEELDDPGDPMFWAPLIAVHAGLRSEEILQLGTDDIRDVDGIPCIVLAQGPGQSLKTHAARRTVPLHQNLIALGLLELAEERRRQGEPRLFPWLERSAAKGTFTETFSKRFTEYRKQHKLYKKGRDFHALRTTFNQSLIKTGCRDSERRCLMGHVEHDVGITSYTPDGFPTVDMLNSVNAIEIDVSMIRRPVEKKVPGTVASLENHRQKRRARRSG